jgi:hypothetical protein
VPHGERLASRLAAKERKLSKRQRYEEAVVFAANGEEMFTVKGGRWTVDFSNHVGELADRIVTHNHPNDGGSFSVEDVAFAIRWNLAEFRAVDAVRQRWVYILRRPMDGWPTRDARALEQLERAASNLIQEVTSELRTAGLAEPDIRYKRMHKVWQRYADHYSLQYFRTPRS